MKANWIILTLTAACFVFIILPAQSQVMNKAYGFMLKKMLSQTVPYISCDSLANINNVILLDTRETNEYTVSNINNSIHLGYENIDSNVISQLNKNDTIVVYCSVGYRSEKVGEQLKQLGFNNVYNLHGGIFEWKNQGYIVVDSLGNETENVHAFSKTWGIWLKKGKKVY